MWDRSFVHDALLYSGTADFVAQVGSVVHAGIERGDRVLVATDAVKGETLRASVGDASDLTIVDMAEVGANPARIIPVWREFLTDSVAAGRGVTGVGEPIWHGRTPDQLVECQQHEVLLNHAFESGPGWSLFCPYDVTELGSDVTGEAMRSHAGVIDHDGRHASPDYLGSGRGLEMLGAPLDPPPPDAVATPFAGDALMAVRDVVSSSARAAGLGYEAVDDLALAVHELATNSVRHGGGGGVLRSWTNSHAFVAEVSDRGVLTDPLVGRAKPALFAEGARGVWLVNQLCDLVQVRSRPSGTVVRAHMFLR